MHAAFLVIHSVSPNIQTFFSKIKVLIYIQT